RGRPPPPPAAPSQPAPAGPAATPPPAPPPDSHGQTAHTPNGPTVTTTMGGGCYTAQGQGNGPNDNFTVSIGKGCNAVGATNVSGGSAGNLTVAIGGGNATGTTAGGSNVNDMTV